VRATRGTLVSTAGQVGAQLLRLVSNLVLSRLLFPEAFGTMAIVFLFVAAVEQVSNLGIQASLVRHPRGEQPALRDTAWTVQIARGLVLWMAGAALAPLVAALYREPAFRALLPAASFGAVLMGLTSTKLLLLTRRLELGRRVAIELAGQAVALLGMLSLAWGHRSVWVLVAGGLVNQAAVAVLSHVWIPGPRDRLAWDTEAARELLSFGKWVFASSGLSFLANQMDVALLGRLVPAGVLGVYSIGTILPNLLRDLLGRLGSSVLMPALSESDRESRAILRARYAAARRVMLPAGLLLALGVAVVAPAFFGKLYDPRYADAGWIAQLALPRFWFAYLQLTSSLALLALGDARTWALSSAIGAAGVTAGCLLGFAWAGLPGLLAGSAVGMAASYLVPALQLLRLGIATPLLDLAYTALGAALAALALGLGPLVGPALGIADPGLRTLALGLAALAPFGLWAARRLLREVRVL
jgi:O-antigen/teichoic acid export membrane protein